MGEIEHREEERGVGLLRLLLLLAFGFDRLLTSVGLPLPTRRLSLPLALRRSLWRSPEELSLSDATELSSEGTLEMGS